MASPDFTYVPTLAVRPSEMNALEQLPGLTKDQMRPVFLLAPWATAKNLTKTVERVEKAFANRQYFLDLDRDYIIPSPENEPQHEFQELLNDSNCYEEWWRFVESLPNAQPCVQLYGQTSKCIRDQVEKAQTLGRQFCLRVELKRNVQNLPDVVDVLNSIGTADYIIILEGGWTQDPLSLFSNFLALINGVLQMVDADVPIVVSSTSMLKDFQNIQNSEEVPFNNRALMDRIKANTNRRYILYGDWGSTRPREPSSHRQRPLDRIDYPTPQSWIIARNREDRWTYKDAAKQIVHNSGFWDGKLNIWGENMILQTIVNPDFGINTPQKNVASRINIHLHRQAFYEADLSGIDFDDDWED